MKKYIGWFIIVLLFIVLDQILKIWVKTNMVIGEQFSIIGNWFYIHFIENSGAAFGFNIPQPWFKPTLTLFRFVIIILIVFYLLKLLRKRFVPFGIKLCFTLILAGAIGNIIDSFFYGLIFSESYGQVAQFLPPKGYAPLLYGNVVDMLYFPIIKTSLPQWIPFWGGKYFEFFSPIFNLADAYISTSIIILLLFFRNWFNFKETNEVDTQEPLNQLNNTEN